MFLDFFFFVQGGGNRTTRIEKKTSSRFDCTLFVYIEILILLIRSLHARAHTHTCHSHAHCCGKRRQKKKQFMIAWVTLFHEKKRFVNMYKYNITWEWLFELDQWARSYSRRGGGGGCGVYLMNSRWCHWWPVIRSHTQTIVKYWGSSKSHRNL